jgi:RING finger family protein
VSAACPYCRGGFESSDVVAMCPACATPHHKDCLVENGGCTVFGCVNAPGDEPKIRVLLEDLGGNSPAFDAPGTALTGTADPNPQPWAATNSPRTIDHRSMAVAPQFGIVMERAIPPPPHLPWPLLQVLSILTAGLFELIWGFVLARWVRDVEPQSRAIYYYSALLVVQLLAMAVVVGGHVDGVTAASGPLFLIAVAVLSLLGRFSMRRSLEDYFDQTTAMGLSLSEAMTFFFGSVYFQYHLNRTGQPIANRRQAIA